MKSNYFGQNLVSKTGVSKIRGGIIRDSIIVAAIIRTARIRVSIIPATIIFAMLFLITGCSKPEFVTETKLVKTTKVSKQNIVVDVEYSAKLKPIEEVVVSPKLFGKVDRVVGDVGMHVTKGDFLFSIETKDVEAQLRQSDAAIESASLNVSRTLDFANPQQLSQVQQAVDLSKNGYDDAKRNYDKVKDLYQSIQVTKQELDDASSKLNSAKIQYENAIKNLEIFKNTGQNQNQQVAAAQLEQAKAAKGVVRTQLDNSIITAPITGEISAKTVDQGEMVSSATSAYTIINSSTLIGEISVPNDIVKRIKSGDKVKIVEGVDEGSNVIGVVETVSPNVDPKTQFYNIKIKIDNKDYKVKAGVFAKVFLEYEKREGSIALPDTSIVNTNGVSFALLYQNGKIKKLPIKIGISDNKFTEIVEGLKEGDEVISEGQNFLSDGMTVKLAN